MAKNWTMAEATKEVLAGNKEAIVDIGKRFPLTANAIAAMGNNEGALTIIGALPEHITARKIESVLKDGVEETAEDEEVTEEKETKKEKPAKKAAKKAKEEDDADEDEDPVALYKQCKKAGLSVKPKQSAKYYKDALAKAAQEEEAEDEDWEDEEEAEEKPKKGKKAAKKEEKKPAKKAAKKVVEEEAEDEEEDDDDWDI